MLQSSNKMLETVFRDGLAGLITGTLSCTSAISSKRSLRPFNCITVPRYVLDWCVACTGLECFMYYTGMLHVLDRSVVCTGLVCCMYWTVDVMHVLDCYYRLAR